MAEELYDGQVSFEGGQDSSFPPSRLPENKYAAGINTSTVGGIISSRFGVERKTLKFPTGGFHYKFNQNIPFKTLFESGKFQAFLPYQVGTKKYELIVISGIIFLVNLETYEVRVLSTTNTRLNEQTSRIYAGIAGRFAVFSDFPRPPVIIEGTTARRSDPSIDELPAFNIGIYNGTRFFFSNAGNEFTAGDPVGSLAAPNAPITVQEINAPASPFLAEIYQLPTRHEASITAMANLQLIDSTTGYGPLLVASEEEIWVYDTTRARDDWIKQGFGKSISDNAGIVSSRAFCNSNSDLFFVSNDGNLRTLSVAQEEQKKWARVPMNLEVSKWVSYLDDSLKKYTAITYFKNKIFWTARPYRVLAQRLNGKPIIDVAHSAFVVLETDNVARMGSDSPPAWAGLWTGLRPMDMNVVGERMFVMSKDYYNRNALYEVDPNLTFDRTDKGSRRYIRSTIYTREHIWGDAFTIKAPTKVEVGVSNIEGNFKLDIEWKPSNSSNFLPWSSFEHNVPTSYTEIPFGGNIPQKKGISFTELSFGAPSTEGDPDLKRGHPVTKELYESGAKRAQFKISIEGEKWQLEQYRITAVSDPEATSEYLSQPLPEETDFATPSTDWTYKEFGA